MRLTCLSSSLDCAVAKRSGLTWPDVNFGAAEVHTRWQLQRADRYIRAHDTRIRAPRSWSRSMCIPALLCRSFGTATSP
jgi:hypothetical protein